MTQQVGITIGIPIPSAIAATQTNLLGGIHLALAVDVVATMIVTTLIWSGLRDRSGLATGESVGRPRTNLRDVQSVAT